MYKIVQEAGLYYNLTPLMREHLDLEGAQFRHNELTRCYPTTCITSLFKVSTKTPVLKSVFCN